MKLQRYALLSSLAASLILAACGGGDGEGDSGNNSGGNSGTPGVKEDWKEYKTISPRCPMGTSVQQDNIHCLRGVFRGKSNYGQACEVDFMGLDGFRVTIDGNSYTYLPNVTPKLDEYRHYLSNQSFAGELIAEKQFFASVDYSNPSSSVTFELVDGKYDVNHWRRLGKNQDIGIADVAKNTFVLFHNFPKEMGAALNISAEFHTTFSCNVESVLYR